MDTFMPDLIWRLRLDESRCHPDYLEQALASPLMRARVIATASGTSASMRKINKKGIATILLPLPGLEDQISYAETCLSIQSLHAALKRESQALSWIRSELLTGLLTGEVAVPDLYDSLLAEVV